MASEPPLAIATQPSDPGWVTLSLRGELDLSTADTLRQRLFDELDTGQAVVLDIAGIDFIDCEGITPIIAALKRATQAGTRLEFAPSLQSQPRRLLELTGLLPLLALHGA